MGTLISGGTKLRDEQFIAAAEAVARAVTHEDLARGAIFPPMSAIREVRVRRAGGKGGRGGGGSRSMMDDVDLDPVHYRSIRIDSDLSNVAHSLG